MRAAAVGAWVGWALALWTAPGCADVRGPAVEAVAAASPLAAPDAMRAPAPAEDTTEFWYGLARRPVATNDAALHALVLYLDGSDPADGYPSRVASLKSRGLLPSNFNGAPEAPVRRGTLAYALATAAGIRGGVTMLVLGPSGRYATRALESRRIFPPGSANQPFSGAQLVGVMGRFEDVQRGDATVKPAFYLPGEEALPPLETLAPLDGGDVAKVADPRGTAVSTPVRPLLLSADGPGAAAPARQPATAPADRKPLKLAVIVTGVEGADAQVRAAEDQPWVPARIGMKLGESAEFRTGPKSAVRFFIRPNHVFTLDRQGSLKVLQAYQDGVKVKTDVGLEQGRVRVAVERLPEQGGAAAADGPAGQPYRVEEAGLERECTIHSPNTALAVRGTLVSLYDQPPFAPEAVSLTGRAVFENVRRERVAFGSRRRGGAAARVSGAQTSAAQQAQQDASQPAESPSAKNDFENQEIARVASRGGFAVGDVLVGSSAGLPQRFPGDLNFVLSWDGGPSRQLHDLNLVVVSPNSFNAKGQLDFVANPPFTLSLDPASPRAIALRKSSREVPPFNPRDPLPAYPRESLSGGRIGLNHVGPEGREVAFWPRTYPTGEYLVQVFNLVDVPSSRRPVGSDTPVEFRVQAFQKRDGAQRPVGEPIAGRVQELEISPAFPVRVTEPPSRRTARAKGR